MTADVPHAPGRPLGPPPPPGPGTPGFSEAPLPAWARGSAAVRLPVAPSLGDVDATWAWGGATGAGVRVAIVDSGIDADHPRLGGRVDAEAGVAARVAADGSVVLVRGAHRDAFGHGTACAGIVHALAPDAAITSVQVLGPGLTGRAAAFLAGLEWAVDQGFDVINLSLGTTRREVALELHDLCDRAYFEGTLVVTAANNVDRVSYPSLFASVVSVACNLATDPFRFHANPDPPTEFLARGVDVEVAWRAGATVRATGNSFAAPHIAGLAALVRSKHPALRPFQVKTVLWATAANVATAPAARAGRISRTRADLPTARRTAASRTR
jgi:subtilisin